MKMINSAADSIRITSDLLPASSWTGDGGRPAFVTVPARGVVEIEDAFALRRQATHRTNADGQPLLLPSAVEGLAPQLQPHGAEALAFYESQTVDDLDHVKRAFAELARAGQAAAGQQPDPVMQAKIDKAYRDGIARGLGVDVPKPLAVPTIEVAAAQDTNEATPTTT